MVYSRIIVKFIRISSLVGSLKFRIKVKDSRPSSNTMSGVRIKYVQEKCKRLDQNLSAIRISYLQLGCYDT